MHIASAAAAAIAKASVTVVVLTAAVYDATQPANSLQIAILIWVNRANTKTFSLVK